jgi:hypothetical protein
MESKEFDDIIKSKLNNIAAVPDARAWDLFTMAALNKGEDEIFDDKTADVLVKSALDNFKIDYDANTWETLVNKMDQPVEDPVLLQRKFDKEISNSLKSVTRKYDSGSWPKLAARIEHEEKYLRHYYRAKFVEACVFIFLILSLVRLGETGKLKLPLAEKSNTADITLDYKEVSSSETDSKQGKNKAAVLPSETNTKENKISLLKIVSTVGKNLSENTKYIHKILTSPSETDNHLPSNIGDLIEINKNSVQPSPSISILENTINPIMDESAVVRSLDNAIASVSLAHTNSLTLQNKLANVNTEINELYVPKRHLNIKKLKKTVAIGEWKLGAYTHFDYNEIYFPESKIGGALGKLNTLPAYTAKSTGYGSGFKALYSKNRLGLEFGAGYSNKSYSPNREYNGSKEFRAYFKNIEYDIVEIPMAVRFLSKANTRMRTFAQAGLNTNFIAKSFYDIATKEQSTRSITTPSARVAEETYFSNTVKREFTKLDNSKVMVYAQGAVGLEWRLNSRVDLSSQLIYSQRILNKKFGDNFDQFKSLSLEIGLKTRL